MARESIDKMVDLTVGEFNGDSASNCRRGGNLGSDSTEATRDPRF